MAISISEVWSDLDHRLIPDALGNIKKVINVDAVMTSIDNILRTYPGERCLVGSTKISLLDGTSPTIQDLALKRSTFWLYTYNHSTGRIEPGKGKAFKTGKKRIISIVLDNGEIIKCTPEHKFLLRNGHYKQARDLQINDSLMPLYLQERNDGYYEIYQPCGIKKSVHQMVDFWKNGYLEFQFCVHHKNFNKKDNNPENLLRINKKLHWKYHWKHAKNWNFRLWHTSEFQWFRELMESGIIQRKEASDPQFSQNISLGIQKHLTVPENREKWSKRTSETLKKTNLDPNMKKITQKNGHKNGLKFWYDSEMADARNRNLVALQVGLKQFQQTLEYQIMLKENGHKVGIQNCLTKLKKHYDIVIENFGVFNEETWIKYKKTLNKKGGYPNWGTIVARGWLEELDLSLRKNHKVKMVLDQNEIEDVYDIHVEKTHNFALASGVFVHNCMLPEFASSLHGIVFENTNKTLLDYLSRDLKETIERWDDRVIISGIKFYSDPDQGEISLTISFGIYGSGQMFTYSRAIKGEII
jgi:intein/homing endonuclease/phage baseplate assembly protein W